MKYSIWVIPPEPVTNTLTDIVKKLAHDFDGPIFEPHMTILGNIDLELPRIIEVIKPVSESLTQLELSFGPVSFSTTYFQNVLIRINSTTKLMQLNMDLKQALNVNNDVFMPHISLLYGNHDMDLREKATQSVSGIDTAFAVNELVITPSTPSPSEWIHSATIPFGKI